MWNLFSDIFDFDIILNTKYSWAKKHLEYGMSYKWRVNSYNFENIWDKFVSPHMNKYAYSAIELATNTIKKLYCDLQAVDIKGDIFEIDMFDIEENEKYHYRNKELYVIFKIMVRAFDIIYQSNKSYSITWMNQTLELKLPLLTRIVLLLLRENTNLTADKKMEYVIKNCGFHDIRLREQVFKLVADIFDDVKERKRDIVLHKIMSVDSSNMVFENEQEKIRHISYIQYNWLNWLDDKCNKTYKVKIELNKIKKVFPNFKPRKRPDLTMGSIETRHGSESPISKEALRGMEAKKVYNYIINFKEDDSFMGSDRYGLLQTLSEVAGEDIKWTIEFVDELQNNKNWEEIIWEFIFTGLRKSVCKKNDLIKVLKHLNEDAIKENTLFIAQFLLDSLEKDDIYNKISNNFRTQLIQLIKIVWDYRQPIEIDSEDWTFLSLNDITGVLTNVMIKNIIFTACRRWYSQMVC